MTTFFKLNWVNYDNQSFLIRNIHFCIAPLHKFNIFFAQEYILTLFLRKKNWILNSNSNSCLKYVHMLNQFPYIALHIRDGKD